jgi:hypothetical protein
MTSAYRRRSGRHGDKARLAKALVYRSTAVRKQFAAVVEQDDAIAQQAPALPGLICHNPCGQVIRCRPFRAPRLVLTHISSAAERLVNGRASRPAG